MLPKGISIDTSEIETLVADPCKFVGQNFKTDTKKFSSKNDEIDLYGSFEKDIRNLNAATKRIEKGRTTLDRFAGGGGTDDALVVSSPHDFTGKVFTRSNPSGGDEDGGLGIEWEHHLVQRCQRMVLAPHGH